MRVAKLEIEDFRQFDHKVIYLGKRLTAIAGNNGTGKSTVLGILANSSELKKYKTYLGKGYKGEFSELFSAAPEFDPSGRHMVLEYVEHGMPQKVTFRTAWQDKGTRFRIIPRRTTAEGRKTESKVESPVIYLGLSRLYPIGETKDEFIGRKSQKWKSGEDKEWFVDNYRSILSMNEEVKSLSSLDIEGISRKKGTGVETSSYGPITNSAGQDNLGQILLSILSFRSLKDEFGEGWDGGLLLIDELDATLHPAAQLKLLKLIESETKSVGFQAVFTTHSTVLLKELSHKTQHNPADAPGEIEVAYLTDASRSLMVKRNPSWPVMESDLLVSSPRRAHSKVGIFSEDDEARWMIDALVKECCPKLLPHIDYIEVSMGCEHLAKLYVKDFAYMRDRVVVFDGDANRDDFISAIPAALLKAGGNVVFLPGKVRPEEIIYEYLIHADEDDAVWEALRTYGIEWRTLNEHGPMSVDYSNQSRERNKYKEWFKDYRDIFDAIQVIHYWIASNCQAAETFIDSFLKAYNTVANRTSAAMIQKVPR